MKLEAKDIEAVLGGNDILRGVSLEVEPNEFVGIIGPNGSGKSTLLKCIYRVLKPQAGIVKLDGTDIRELSYKKSAQSIAVLAQHNYYNFEFSVQDVVLMGRSPHKRAMERDNAQDYAIVAQALETVGMADMAKRSFSTLSGGEQQRVILARALAQQTPCLILDEPTNHLDITYQLELMDIVQGLGPHGCGGHSRSEHCSHVLHPAVCHGKGAAGCLRNAGGGAYPGAHPAGIRREGQGIPG